MSEHDQAWQIFHLQGQDDGSFVGLCETNDNLDQGYASEYTSWPVEYKDRETMEKRTGLTHVGISGIQVTVLVDGQVCERKSPCQADG